MNNAATPTSELESLRKQIRYHDRKYYIEAEPEISDLEYDRLMNALKDLEAAHPQLITSDSPTQRVGEEVTGSLRQIEHRIPMLSIENTYDQAELSAFLNRTQKALEEENIEWVLELKIDGVAAAIIYENGQLAHAVTRGNGTTGDDITHNIKTIPDVPLRLSGSHIPPLLEVRGEAYMRNSDLTELNLLRAGQGQAAFANTRNVTAGTIRLQDPRIAAERRLRFFAHGIGYCEGLRSENHLDFLAELKDYGLPATPHVFRFDSAGEVLEKIDSIQAELHELDFEVDGLVLKVNSFAQRERLGNTAKSPRWVAAYKIEKYEATTKLSDIKVQVGKTGTITPVAELEPVQLAGTTVSRASLHNAEEIARKDIRIGDWIVVEKAGKIIPHVVRVEAHRREPASEPYQFPSHCPECHSELIKDEGGVYIRCTNEACPAKLRQRLKYFASREGMDIDGLGEKIVDQLVDARLVQGFADVYKLTRDQLLTLEAFGDKKADKILNSLEESKSRGLARLLASVSIRHVGSRVASLIAARFTSIEELREASQEDVAEIDEIGETIAESLTGFLHSDYGTKTLTELAEQGVLLEERRAQGTAGAADAQNAFADKTFVVTGTLEQFSRDQVKQLIEEHGGRVAGSVSSKTSYLVAGENAGSKLEKAKQLNVEILSEEEFRELLATGSNALTEVVDAAEITDSPASDKVIAQTQTQTEASLGSPAPNAATLFPEEAPDSESADEKTENEAQDTDEQKQPQQLRLF